MTGCFGFGFSPRCGTSVGFENFGLLLEPTGLLEHAVRVAVNRTRRCLQRTEALIEETPDASCVRPQPSLGPKTASDGTQRAPEVCAGARKLRGLLAATLRFFTFRVSLVEQIDAAHE